MQRTTVEEPDPDRVHTRADFGAALSRLRESADLSVRHLAAASDVPTATLGGYLTGRHLPSINQLGPLRAVLAACGVTDPDRVQQWIDALHRARAASDGRSGHRRSPYPGLEPFDTTDAPRFFGRSHEVARVVVGLQRLVAVDEAPLLAVVGSSGSGKSSLLRAGVIPAIAAGGLDGRPATWELITPGADPSATLDGVFDRAAPPPRLLVVDQFEELFTQCRDEVERRAFLQRLTGLRPSHTLVVIGLRADFYPAATAEPLLVRALNDAQVVLGPMTRAELRAAITGPAAQAGAVVEDGLVELLLSELAPHAVPGPGDAARPHAPASDLRHAYHPGALPLLSYALLATWDHAQRNQLTVADYRAGGGLHGAVAQSAEDAYGELDAGAQEYARRIFCRLVTVGDEDAVITRRRVERTELEAMADAADTAGPPGAADTVTAVVDRFVAHRLLTVDAHTVQLSHEALLSAWPRLGEWLDDDRQGLRLHRQLTQAANVWDAAGRDPGTLLRGARLEAVSGWADDPSHRATLNRTETEHLEAALAHRDAEHARERHHTRRLRQLLAAVAALFVVAGALAGYSWHATGVAEAQRSAARQARDQALSREVALEVAKLRTSHPALAAQLALAGYRISPTPEANAALLDTSALPGATRLLGPPGAMQALAVNHAGTLLAATGADGQVHLWAVHGTGDPTTVGTLPVQRPGKTATTLFALAFSPDGRLLATAGAGRSVQLWDVSDPARPHRDATLTGPTNTVYTLAFSPDGSTLAAGSADRLIHRWSVTAPTAPTTLTSLSGAAGYVQAVAFGPTGTTIAAGTTAGTVDVWSLDRSKPVRVATAHVRAGDTVFAVAISPDGHQLAAGTGDGTVHRWDITDPAHPTPLADLTGSSSWVNAVAYSPDGTYLASGGSDQTVRLWSAATGTLQRTITAANVVTALAFLPDGHHLAATTNEGTALIWPVAGPVLSDPNEHIFSVGYDRNSTLLAAGADGHAALLWSTAASPPTLLSRIPAPTSALRLDGSSALSPDGTLLAAGTAQGPVLVWDVHDARAPRLVATLRGSTDLDEYVTFSPDGRLVAAAGDDAQVHLWDVSVPGHPVTLPPLTGLDGIVYNIAFSPDGRLLAVPTSADTVQVWQLGDARHARRLATISDFGNYAQAVAFTPDGRTLAVGSADKTVRIYDVSVPSAPRLLGPPLTGPTGYVYDVAIGPDGRRLAAGSIDGTVWLWNIADPARPVLLADLTATSGSAVYAVAFAPKGNLLAAGAADGTVHRWELDPDAVAAQVCHESGAPITSAEWHEYVPGAPYRPPCR